MNWGNQYFSTGKSLDMSPIQNWPWSPYAKEKTLQRIHLSFKMHNHLLYNENPHDWKHFFFFLENIQ